ncbi:ferredoxin reductase [Rhodococcus sp. B50]|uniref:ferredoxin reductase n=1 Tax=Rhodococcus sp. B50 TaxID=2682847 RepID=UPI001BD566A9|nr:ferredoxin reductase [Rhodococcus sp. B50]MBS9372881.1 NADPH oxidoreductase [Rhodococcus sp. B50]
MIVRDRPTPVPRPGLLRKLLVGALELVSYPHHPDRYLELADPLLVTSANYARITHVDRSAADSLTITVRPARPCRPLPGQYVTVAVRVGGVRHTRCYSPTLVEAETQRHPDLRFTIGRHPDGTVSRHLHDRASVGDVVELGPVAGEFLVPSPRPRRLLFVAAGSGLTPVLSMLTGLVAEGYDGSAVLLYYTRTPGHIPRRAELDALADRPNIEIVHAHTRSDEGLLHGRFDRAHLAAVAPWYADTPTYVCGPAEMVASIREVYAEHGAETMVNTEEFVLAARGASTGEAGGEVSFAESGVVAENTGSTLLEQAEAAGLTPEHGCRMGICHSCTAVRLSGCTRDVRTGDVDSEPGRRIQICVNAPVGDVAVEL